MSEPQHTPGPFLALKGAEKGDEMRCAVVAVRDRLQYLVATIENGAPGDICDTEYVNACLFAAAPELLEALEKTRDTLRKLQPALNVMAREVMDDVIRDQVEPAIAKARGQ